MSAEGSQGVFLKRKCLPFITGFNWVAGIFWITVGAIVISQEKTHAAVSSLPIQRAPVLLLVAGILAILVGCVGCYCLRKPDFDVKKPLIVFIVLLALVLITALAGGIFGMLHLKRLNNEFEGDFKKMIEKYGITGHYKMLVNIDRLQKEDKCCGVINYVDWRNTIYSGHRYDKVPDSCCKQEEHACGFEFELSKINHRGCSAIAVNMMTIHLRLVGLGGIILGVLEAILCISFVCCYLRKTYCSPPNEALVEGSYRKKDRKSQQVLDHETEERHTPPPTAQRTTEAAAHRPPDTDASSPKRPKATTRRVRSPQGILPSLRKTTRTPKSPIDCC